MMSSHTLLLLQATTRILSIQNLIQVGLQVHPLTRTITSNLLMILTSNNTTSSLMDNLLPTKDICLHLLLHTSTNHTRTSSSRWCKVNQSKDNLCKARLRWQHRQGTSMSRRIKETSIRELWWSKAKATQRTLALTAAIHKVIKQNMKAESKCGFVALFFVW